MQYQVRLYDTNGAQTAVFDTWHSLYFFKRLNDFGYHTFSIDGDDPRTALFTPDCFVEVLRRDVTINLAWYREYVGFHRTGQFQVTDNGRQVFTSYGRGMEDLLHRRIILFKTGVFTSYSGVAADNAMKAIVLFNVGSNATLANSRIANGVTLGFSVAANTTQAPPWNGDRTFKNVLDVLQEISEAKSVDFDVKWNGGQTFLFSTYYPQFGVNRTGSGPAAPVVFSLEHANMSSPYLTTSRVEEITAVYVLGQGEGVNRTVVERLNTSEVTLTPWNRIEFGHDARNESTVAALNDIGDGHLLEHGVDKHLSFQVLQSPGTVYGRDYFIGDVVVGRILGVEETRKVTGVEITVSQGKEDVRIHFGGE